MRRLGHTILGFPPRILYPAEASLNSPREITPRTLIVWRFLDHAYSEAETKCIHTSNVQQIIQI